MEIRPIRSASHSLATNLSVRKSIKKPTAEIVKGPGGRLLVDGPVSPITPLTKADQDRVLAAAASWDRQFAGGGTGAAATMTRQFLVRNVLPRMLKYLEQREAVRETCDAYDRVVSQATAELGILLAPSPRWNCRLARAWHRMCGRLSERVTGTMPLHRAWSALSTGTTWRQLPNKEGLAQLVNEDMRERLAPYKPSLLSHLGAIFEIPALLPLAHVVLKICAVDIRNPAAAGVAIALMASIVAVAISFGAKRVLVLFIKPWLSRKVSAASRTGTVVVLPIIGALLVGWYSMDFAYVASQIAARRIHLPANMAAPAALFFVALATNLIVAAAFKQAKYETASEERIADLAGVWRKNGHALAKLPADADEGHTRIYEAVYAALSLVQSLDTLKSLELALATLPRTAENYNQILGALRKA